MDKERTNSDFQDSKTLTPQSSGSHSRPQLLKLPSGNFLDDQGVYQNGRNSEEDDEFNHIVDEERPTSEEAIAEKDVEAQGDKLERSKSAKSKISDDPNLVTWTGPDDPDNPKNWPPRKKWAATLTVSMFTFISPLTSSMIAPALSTMAKELGITTSFESSMVLSIFILAYAIGPLFLGPLSEVFGRVRVLQIANLFFLAFNLGCGFATNKNEIIAFRFFSGLGGSVPLAVGGGVLSDVWFAEQRGRALSIYTAGPLLGPAIGPIAGGFIAERTTWRWTFWSISIYNAVVQVLGIFLLRETYAPTLLTRRAERLRKETGNAKLFTEYDHPDRTLFKVIETALQRPFRLLFTQPIIQVLAIYQAYLYGVMYLILTTFPTIWTDVYHESIGIGGLNYIALGVGFVVGTQTCAPMIDRIYIRLKRGNNNVGRPEFRVPLMIPGAIFVPVGIFIYGWTAQYHTHWMGPNVGVALFCAALILTFQCNQSYIVDSYPRYAASALSAVTFLRSLAGFGFPLFASAMYEKLGLGWGNSLLGFLAIVFGIPAPFLLWKYGEKLRAKSRFAAG